MTPCSIGYGRPGLRIGARIETSALRSCQSVIQSRPGLRIGARIETSVVNSVVHRTSGRPGLRIGARIETQLLDRRLRAVVVAPVFGSGRGLKRKPT